MASEPTKAGAPHAAAAPAEDHVPTRRRLRPTRSHKRLIYTARLGVDVTPQMRARIKVSAFKRGMTVAELLRELLDREFPADISGEAI